MTLCRWRLCCACYLISKFKFVVIEDYAFGPETRPLQELTVVLSWRHYQAPSPQSSEDTRRGPIVLAISNYFSSDRYLLRVSIQYRYCPRNLLFICKLRLPKFLKIIGKWTQPSYAISSVERLRGPAYQFLPRCSTLQIQFQIIAKFHSRMLKLADWLIFDFNFAISWLPYQVINSSYCFHDLKVS